MVRKWSCQKKMCGYLIRLQYGDYEINRFVDSHILRATGNINSYLEYQIIRLNRDLCDMMFPLTRFLEQRIFPT